MDTQSACICYGSMSRETFCRFSEFVTRSLGIKMPATKKTMLQGRLRKRMRKLGIVTFEEYCDYVFSDPGMETELSHMIDSVTTNKTDFFREPKHFQYLSEKILPEMILNRQNAGSKPWRFWSAGCATGAEPYSLAMLLSEAVETCPEFSFSILATDISRRVLEEAKDGIYKKNMAELIPMAFRKKYLLKSKDPRDETVRIVPRLRSIISFGRLNFISESYSLERPMDVVFCRNVLIYFDRPTQEKVIQRICRHINPGGYLFVGHSETLNGMDVPLAQVNPTIYRRM